MKTITTTYPSTLATLLTCVCVSNAQGQPPPADLELIKVYDDLYVIHNEVAPGNATALITDDGVLLIDDKYERDYDNMVKLLRSVTDQPVRFVINTHHHGDHSGSNARFQAAGAEIVASERARLLFSPVSLPSQTGDEQDRASRCGRK